MNISQLIAKLQVAYEMHGDGEVVGQLSDGLPCEVYDLTSEAHIEADGSVTHWLKMEGI